MKKLWCFLFGHEIDKRYKPTTLVNPITFDTYKTCICKRCQSLYIKSEEAYENN